MIKPGYMAQSAEGVGYIDNLFAKSKISPNKCPGYDIKQSDGEAPVMLELWVMWSTSLLLSLPGPIWFTVVALDRVLPIGQIELFDI